MIATPPQDRLAVKTEVHRFDEDTIRDAILRELDRGGQVFYVHNRVETIDAQAEQLRRLLPSARIAVGHGQMAEGQLEKIMLAFASGEHDVLVSTTIIESGLDIPNANTIVIDRADALGLMAHPLVVSYSRAKVLVDNYLKAHAAFVGDWGE